MNLLQLLKKLQKMKKLLKQAIMTERSIKTETVDANDGQLTFGWQTLRLLHRQICFSGFALSPRLSMKADRIDRIVFLGGGFKYFLCSPLFGEDSQFD